MIVITVIMITTVLPKSGYISSNAPTMPTTSAMPMKERYIISSNVSSSTATARPATAMAENEMIAPIIQIAAFKGSELCECAVTQGLWSPVSLGATLEGI